MSTRYDKLDQLGQMKGLPASPDEAVLERVKNPCDEDYMVRLVAGYVLVDIGIRAGVFQLMCFINSEKRQKGSGYLTKACRLIGVAVSHNFVLSRKMICVLVRQSLFILSMENLCLN